MRIVFPFSVSLSLGALALAFVRSGRMYTVWPVVILAALWLWGHYRRWHGVADIAFSGLVFMVIVGALTGLSVMWLLLAVVTALLAWDVDHFIRRVDRADFILLEPVLVRQHRRRLGWVLGLGSALAWMGLRAKIELNFALALFLALLVVVGLSGVVKGGRRP